MWYTVHSIVYTCELILARIWLLGLCPFINRVLHPVIEAIWQLECDGAYCKNGLGASAVLTAPSMTQFKYAARLDFPGCTNNVAEYEGLLLGLRKARALGARRLSIKSDSEIITNHIGKTYIALKPELAKYLAAVCSMEKYFLGFSVRSFPRI